MWTRSLLLPVRTCVITRLQTIMWNDTEIPLAIFFSFRTYGTWLHGDDRGSTDRHNNIYRTSHIPANDNWHRHNREMMKSKPVFLDAARRQVVDASIMDTCLKRGWSASAVNVRTNHAHSVICVGGYDPDRALGALKANATRAMREAGCWSSDRTPWVEKGSCRRLWNERSVWEASDYVLNRQGEDLSKYEWW